MSRLDIYNLKQWLNLAWQSSYNAGAICQHLDVSQRQLGRYTNKLFGRSPQDWLDEQRMLVAPGMLKKHRSAKAVAFQLGFKQASHFTREFKLYYGVTPTGFMIWSDVQDREFKARNQKVPAHAKSIPASEV